MSKKTHWVAYFTYAVHVTTDDDSDYRDAEDKAYEEFTRQLTSYPLTAGDFAMSDIEVDVLHDWDDEEETPLPPENAPVN